MRNLREAKDYIERAEIIESAQQTSIAGIKKSFIDEEKSVHCENLVGAVTLPLGIAGPVVFSDDKSGHFIPLATTEGALVASVNRGCRVIAESGGVDVIIIRPGTTRGPVFRVKSAREGMTLEKWIREHEAHLKAHAESTSHHLKYLQADIKRVGEYVFVRFSYDTDEAMGMNMATIATQAIAELIEHETGIHCLSVAGNYDIDKKPSWLNFIKERGFSVSADITIKKDIVTKILKTTPKSIFEVWLGKCMVGSAISGAIGFNAHYANIIAAYYAATGQDLAHVVEGSHGITTFRVTESGNLYMSVNLPAVLMAAVGGGTKLKTQREAITVTGFSDVYGLVKIAGAAVLAGELSLMASLAEHTLARAHKKLGR